MLFSWKDRAWPKPPAHPLPWVHVFTLAFAPPPGMQPHAGPCRQPSSSWLRPSLKPLPRTFCTLCSPRASAPKRVSPGKRGSWWRLRLRSPRGEPMQTSRGGHARPFALCSPGGALVVCLLDGERWREKPGCQAQQRDCFPGEQGWETRGSKAILRRNQMLPLPTRPPCPKGGKPSFRCYSCEC